MRQVQFRGLETQNAAQKNSFLEGSGFLLVKEIIEVARREI